MSYSLINTTSIESVLSIKIKFPKLWKCKPTRNIFSSVVTETVMKWIDENDIAKSGSSIHIRAHNLLIGDFGGSVFPNTTYDRLLDICKLYILIMLLDDTELELTKNPTSYKDLLTTKLEIPIKNKTFDLIRQIFLQMKRQSSDEYTSRNVDGAIMWINSAISENIIESNIKKGKETFNFQNFLEIRKQSCGAIWGLTHLEYAGGYYLPKSFLENPLVLQLKEIVSEIVSIDNDLAGIGKDLQTGKLSIVTAFIKYENLDLNEAIQRSLKIHEKAIIKFDEIALQINGIYPLSEIFVAQVRYYTSGLISWQTGAPRYTINDVVIDKNKLLFQVCFS